MGGCFWVFLGICVGAPVSLWDTWVWASLDVSEFSVCASDYVSGCVSESGHGHLSLRMCLWAQALQHLFQCCQISKANLFDILGDRVEDSLIC